MTKSIVEGSQNVEVSVKLPPEKSAQEQLAIMEEYTQVHQKSPEFGNSPLPIIPATLVDAGNSFVKILYFLYRLY